MKSLENFINYENNFQKILYLILFFLKDVADKRKEYQKKRKKFLFYLYDRA